MVAFSASILAGRISLPTERLTRMNATPTPVNRSRYPTISGMDKTPRKPTGCNPWALLDHAFGAGATAAGFGGGGGSGGFTQTGSVWSFEAAMAIGFKVAWPQATS